MKNNTHTSDAKGRVSGRGGRTIAHMRYYANAFACTIRVPKVSNFIIQHALCCVLWILMHPERERRYEHNNSSTSNNSTAQQKNHNSLLFCHAFARGRRVSIFTHTHHMHPHLHQTPHPRHQTQQHINPIMRTAILQRRHATRQAEIVTDVLRCVYYVAYVV